MTTAASNRDIPVPIAAVRMASRPPPNSRIRLDMWIEKSTPTPTKIEPIITVTNDKSTSILHITSHCKATVAMTGEVVKSEYLISLNTMAKVISVRTTAKPRDVECLNFRVFVTQSPAHYKHKGKLTETNTMCWFLLDVVDNRARARDSKRMYR